MHAEFAYHYNLPLEVGIGAPVGSHIYLVPHHHHPPSNTYTYEYVSDMSLTLQVA